MVRRVLITGATGGLGLALVRSACERGLEVVASGRSLDHAATITACGARFVAHDLEGGSALEPLLEGTDSIIHAAALSASWGPRAAFDAANVMVTERLLTAARRAGASRFVFVSSPSIFARFDHHEGITMAAAPAAEPLNHYARTKLAAERLVRAAHAPDFATCALRPRALVGPGDRVILPRLVQLARRQRMPLPGGGNARIEFTDLRDAADAILRAEDRAPMLEGAAINISGGKPVTVRAVAMALAETLGTSPRLINLPMPLARLIAATGEHAARLTGRASEPLLTRYTLATLGYSQTFDMGPAERLLGFRPRHDALKTLLAEAAMLR